MGKAYEIAFFKTVHIRPRKMISLNNYIQFNIIFIVIVTFMTTEMSYICIRCVQ